MAQQWFVQRGESTEGPYSPQELKKLVTAGCLSTSDLVRLSDQSEWRKAGTIKGLFRSRMATTNGPPPLPLVAMDTASSDQEPLSSPIDASTQFPRSTTAGPPPVERRTESKSGREARPVAVLVTLGCLGMLTIVTICCGGLGLTARTVITKSHSGPTEVVSLPDLMGEDSIHDYTGKQVVVSGTQISVSDLRGGRHRLTLHTEQGYALCELNEDHVRRAYQQSGEMTIIGELVGVTDGTIELTDCRFADEVVHSVTKLDAPRIASKDDFLATFRRLGGQITPAIDDSRGEYFSDRRRCQPTLGSEVSYDEWMEVFGEPVQVRYRANDDPIKHEWTQDFGSFQCRLSGVLFTPSHYEPWKRAGGYEDQRSLWKIHVRAISFD